MTRRTVHWRTLDNNPFLNLLTSLHFSAFSAHSHSHVRDSLQSAFLSLLLFESCLTPIDSRPQRCRTLGKFSLCVALAKSSGSYVNAGCLIVVSAVTGYGNQMRSVEAFLAFMENGEKPGG